MNMFYHINHIIFHRTFLWYVTYDLGDTLFAALDQKRVPLNHIKFPLGNRQTDGVLAEHILTELFES